MFSFLVLIIKPIKQTRKTFNHEVERRDPVLVTPEHQLLAELPRRRGEEVNVAVVQSTGEQASRRICRESQAQRHTHARVQLDNLPTEHF